MSFSFFTKNIHSKKPSGEMTLREVYEMITTDMLLKQTTLELRAGMRQKNIDLPFITPSGLFNGRKLTDLVTYTGILCIDLDDVTDPFAGEKLMADTLLQPGLLFVSPSGDGLKVFYRLSNAVQEDHLRYWKTISAYLLKTYGLPADDHCIDVPRCCYLCHDPTAWYSEACVEAAAVIALGENDRTTARGHDNTTPPNQHISTSAHQPISTSSNQHIITSSDLNRHPLVHEMAVGALENAGWKAADAKQELWRRPGKESGHSATWTFYAPHNAYSFYNFSSNAPHPFEANKSYKDLDLLAMLEYGGDGEQCVKTICEKLNVTIGEGAPPRGQLDYFCDRSIREVLEEGRMAKEQRKIAGAFLYQDTTTYLFSRTNYGKSLLVFQMAYAAATGTDFHNCVQLKNHCEPMKVLVVDLELEPRVLFKRHAAVLENGGLVHENLRYLHEKIDSSACTGLDLLQKIEDYALYHQAELVIIDNISKLLPDSLKPDVVTSVIDALNKIRKRTGASMLVIGHTTKGNPRVAIQPTDYFGSSMVQNFFAEVSYLDMTNDGRFFLCQSKTKQEECYSESVPVFTRGAHPVVGVGFTFQEMRNIADIQLPFMLQANASKEKRKDIRNYFKEISAMDKAGINRTTIAEIFGTCRKSIYNLLET